MKTLITITVLLTFNFFCGSNGASVLAQVMQEWISIYDGPEHQEDYPKSIAVDNIGNVYVTGYSEGGLTNKDYLTIKYNSAGDTVWVRRYDDPTGTDDAAIALALDESGNVYVTGGSAGDFATIKYNTLGDMLWVRKWDAGFNLGDGAYDIALDTFGNVYVTGITWANHWNCATVKYNSQGIEQWGKVYAGPGFDFDEAYAVAVDNSGNVFITGRTGPNGTFDYLTIKYSTNGDSLWARTYDGTGNDVDEAYDIAVDNLGNAYVTGSSLGTTSGYDYVTIKYSPSGDSLWVRRYNGTANDVDEAYSIAVDGSGNIYVTGKSNSVGTSFDYVTIKYNTDGVEQWVQRYDGQDFNWDIAHSITLDDSGNVYVTGESQGGSPGYNDLATVKYNSSGVEQWVQRYNGVASSSDVGRSIAVDGFGNVYVTGESVGIGTEWDYATIKYSQSATGVNEINSDLPTAYSLYQNYPNPFNPSTTISFSIPTEELVSLKVFDSLGEEVARLMNEVKPSGNYSVSFDASKYSSGVYLYRIQTDKYSFTRKMTLIK